ncbi:solute carrier family 22 member 7-like isoform X1 [Nerophis lumbriciformis]|uniref:solute carrier family 22 member 7-like isoform X1 n=1 Tax=Nerophis lumbriciformis TaxID=546530 RepID=UPI002ADFDB9F|nr:solute carrier family 22 member 7-like isoform X1 [Nerophis lumbriciformis]
MNFDDTLEDVGSFGTFQLVLIVLLASPRIVLPCHFLLNNFIAAVPPHRCDISQLDHGALWRNLSEAQRVAVSVPLNDDGEPQGCRMFATPQFQMLENISDADKLPTTACQHGWTYLNHSSSFSLATEWDLVCDWKHLPKMTSTIFFIGVMMGAVVFGVLSDNYGRKRCLLASYIIGMTFGFCSAFAKSYVMFAALRFLSGVGLTGISITAFTLNMEWVDAAHRSLVCVISSLMWSLGNMLLGASAYLVQDWRALVMTVTSPLILATLTWWWLPESSRWLLANGRVEEAEFYLDKCAAMNKRGKLSTKLKLQVKPSKVQKYTYLHLVKTPKLRRLTLIMGLVWYGVAVTYYGISLNIVGFGVNIYLTHFIFAAIEVPAKLLIYVLINKIGRRKCLAGTLILTGSCIAINIILPKDLWHLRSAVAIIGKGLSEASFTTVFLYTTELFPTVLRQNGLGFTGFTSRVGVSVAPLILLMEEAWLLLPQVVLGVGAVVFGLVAMLLPETLGARLPETIDDVEKRGSPAPTKPSGVLLGATMEHVEDHKE